MAAPTGTLRTLLAALAMAATPLTAAAQVGAHRNDLAIGVGGGYAMGNIGFVPKVPQGLHGGYTAGITARYVCEKYFSTVCSVQGEVNYTRAGWRERILDINDNPVLTEAGEPERYARTLSYIQVPLLAHLAWGRERKGFQFFFHAGPQFGYLVGEETDTNFRPGGINYADRVSLVTAQDTMAAERRFDYGIAAGAGVELSVPGAGHFMLEGRYYYGLGNIYGDSKRDYFGKSNIGSIIVKLTYLIDILKTK